ncbi:hypothetical protein QW71_10485 [Paenibacillus sp. IHB B 3415]|nr:hypothetical protein QW71_10485 [Paenibacillus sp. IHB B 3415]
MYAKNRTQWAAMKVPEPNVCEKPNTMCCHEGTRAKCMRKTEYNVLPWRYPGQMYAKDRIQYAAMEVTGPNVCEKPNTMCCHGGTRAKCKRKTEYNMLLWR